jgi:hypothetical protein
MELVIDRDFMDNFYLKYKDENEYHADIRDFFKKIKDFKLVTNYQSVDELKKEAEESNPFLHELFETSVPEIEFRQQLNKDVQQDDFYYSGSPFKLLFIEDKRAPVSVKHGYESINSDNIEIKWKPFFKGRNAEQNVLKTTKSKTLERHERLEQWEDLSVFSHPTHSIIIADRFALDNLKDNKFSLEKNLFPLLSQLIGNKENNRKIDLLIITRKFQGSIHDVYNKIDSFLKDSPLLTNYHFCLIVEPPNLKFEHFRRIYTNYFQIKIENSLNVFKDNGSYSDKNNEFTFNFILNQRNYRFAKKELEDISHFVKQVRNREKVDNDTEKIYFIPDKQNKILNKISLSA